MIKIIKYSIVVLSLLTLSTCKKKTTIKVKLLNPALNEYVANATIALVERHEGGWSSASCKEIASAVTDANGECFFDKEKLKKNKTYFLAISYAYGQQETYPCGGKTSGFLEVGESNEQLLNASNFDAYLKVQYNNLLNPAQPGDSLYVYITSPKYSVPGEPYPFGGGGVFIAFPFYGCNGYPFPTSFQTTVEKTNAGRHIMTIYKKKMGVITTSIDTVRIYPYETKTIEINW